jgi:hypothetical protein
METIESFTQLQTSEQTKQTVRPVTAFHGIIAAELHDGRNAS